MSKLRMLSLCSGIGGADLAAEWTKKIEIVGQVEIDAFCQAVLAKHWPSVKRLSDIKDVQGDEFGAIDIVAGGIPCQPFSIAGERRGVEDDRHLWPEMFRIVKEARPTWVVVENVDDFVEMALEVAAIDLESKGYEVQAFVLPACAVGAPHIRERCFIVAHASSAGWEELDIATVTTGTGHVTRRNLAPGNVRPEYQPAMGRGAYGLSYGLDGYHWPARPGEMQHAWEPPRTVTQLDRTRAKRLKALGNAIVPQQIYPIFRLIVEIESEHCA